MKDINNLERAIESTLLRPDADEKSIVNLCKQALEYNFIGVCVNPGRVALASSFLIGSQTRLVTVIGFPLGANETIVKLKEAQEAVDKGTREIDMVLNIGALKDKNLGLIKTEMDEIVKIGVPVKLIIETGYLIPEEICTVVECAVTNGITFIKTSTGYGPRGGSVQDVKFLRTILPGNILIKASGGIKNLSQAKELIKAGADRLGTSAAEQIIIEHLNSKKED